MASEALSRPTLGGAAKRSERTMDGNFGIGRFGGVEVRINWSLPFGPCRSYGPRSGQRCQGR